MPDGARLLLVRGVKMIYRKAPPQPPKLLLRIVSAAGAGVLVGAAACGGVADSQIHGSVVQTPDDSGQTQTPDDSGNAVGDEYQGGEGLIDSGFPDTGPEALPDVNGFVVYPDAGDATDMDVVGIDAGILISPDASDAGVSDANDVDSSNQCHVLGICIRPDASLVCHGVCIAPEQ
jgi:hypothetical protein